MSRAMAAVRELTEFANRAQSRRDEFQVRPEIC
jgi:hypothetical protein